MSSSICIAGNSVTLLVRPPRTASHEKTYGEILRDHGYSLIHAGKQAVLAADIYRYLEDEVIRYFPDYVVLHFGIVESTCRARPRWLQNFFALNDWANNIVGSSFNSQYTRIVKIALRKIYRHLIERAFYATRLSWNWLSAGDFRIIYLDLIRRLFQETPARKILLIGITKVTDALERRVPGTRAKVEIYNAVMRDISSAVPDVVYIALDTGEFANFSTDGVHLTAGGHMLLACHIEANLSQERSSHAVLEHRSPFPLEEKLGHRTSRLAGPYCR